MKEATEIFKEQISECELKFTQKERLVITSMIIKAQIDAIDEAALVIKEAYPSGLTNTAKVVSDNVLKLKKNI